MSIIGSGSGSEHKRSNLPFMRGIVVKNNDPAKLNRVKIFIPNVSNQPYDDWLEKFDKINLKAPGKNNPDDNWSDTKMYEEIAAIIPWAEPCFPIFGEGSNFKYYKDGEICTISDCNYPEGFEVLNKEPPTLEKGSFSPAFLYENFETVLPDAFTDPTNGSSVVKCNPYSYLYRPSKHANKAKGMISVPDVGTKVWVFHYEEDLNYPVYFGVHRDFRELTLINNTDNEKIIGSKYPSDFDN